jgi:DNA repair protein RadC
LVHNHPSGYLGPLTPNEADKNFTDHMLKAGKLLNIEVVDHLIITETKYYSFNERGYMLLLNKSGKYEITTAETEDMKTWKMEIERKKAKDEAKRAMALSLLKEGLPAEFVVKHTALGKVIINKMIREMGANK